MVNDIYMNESCLTANRTVLEDTGLLTPDNADTSYKIYGYDSLSESNFADVLVGNYVDCDGSRKIIGNTLSHAMIIGGTGSGKTEGYFLPAIEAYAKSKAKVSMFITDIKGSTYAKTRQLLLDNGYNIYVLDFKEPFSSMRYNPLSNIFDLYAKSAELKSRLKCSDTNKESGEYDFNGKTYCDANRYYAEIDKYSRMLLARCQSELDYISKILIPLEYHKDMCWDYGSRDIVFSTLWGMLEDSEYPERKMTRDKFTIANLINITQNTRNECTRLIEWIIARPKPSYTYRLLSYYGISAKVTRDSYINNTANKLNRFANIPIETITATSDLDIKTIVDSLDNKKTAIYCLTDENMSISHSICSIFIYQLLQALQQRRDKQDFGEAAPFVFLLDEFANLPTLPDMERWLSTSRSRNIWFHLGIQSFGQLKNHYSPEELEVIMDNCDTQIFLGSNNYATVEDFSTSLGKTCKTVSTYSVDNNGRISANFMPENLPLVRHCDLAGLLPGHAYVKCFRKPVLYTELNHFYTYHKEKCSVPDYGNKVNLYDATDNYYDISNIGEQYNAQNRNRNRNMAASHNNEIDASAQKESKIDNTIHYDIDSSEAQELTVAMVCRYFGRWASKMPYDKIKEIGKIQTAIIERMKKCQVKAIGSTSGGSSLTEMLGIIHTGAAENPVQSIDEVKMNNNCMYCEIFSYSDDNAAFMQILRALDKHADLVQPDVLYISVPKANSCEIQKSLTAHGFKALSSSENTSCDRIAYKL